MKLLTPALTAAVALTAMTTNAAAADYRVETVSFVSGTETLVGALYIPEGVSAADQAEAVVVTGAWTTIKEQMPATYAAELAERGFVALTFDFRTWGESEGATRSLENPTMKIEDIQAAAAFLAARTDVSTVNGLGICASAGYMATAAAQSDALDSIALVAPWLHDAALVEAVYGGPEGVASLIEVGRAAAAEEAQTGQPQLITAGGPTGSDALMAFDGYYSDPNRGMIPEWENTFNLASWEGWLTFDGIQAAGGIQAPTLIVHSDAAAIPQGAQEFYDRLTAPKQAVWLDGVSQFDFYDQAAPVNAAADAAASHFMMS